MDLRSKNYSFVIEEFENFKDGISELKSGKISAFLVFPEDFSKLLLQFNKKPRRRSDMIEVYQDQSNYIISGFIKNSIHETFSKFNDKIGNCEKRKKPIVPIRREDVHGELNFNLRKNFVASGIIMLSILIKLELVRINFSIF
jgi:hypothetical protein